MKSPRKILISAILAVAMLAPTFARGAVPIVELTQKTAEAQIRHMIEPLLQRYCPDQCKLLTINITVDVAPPDEIAPGFDQVDPTSDNDLAPSSARLKMLIDDQIGPQSRRHLLDLLQENLDTLNYPAVIDTQLVHFPQPIGSASRIADMRERIAKQFRSTLDELFAQFCPKQCLLADLDLKTDVVNGEEAQYGSPDEFVQDDGFALRIRQISATVIMDDTLTPQEQQNVLEMARLKTNSFKNVLLTGKAMHFPTPTLEAQRLGLQPFLGLDDAGREEAARRTSSDSKSTSESSHKSESMNDTRSTSQSSTNSSTNSDQKNNSVTNENNTKEERFERIEKIERVESGDAVQKELDKFKVYGLIFACSILSLLIFIALSTLRVKFGNVSTINRVIHSLSSDPLGAPEHGTGNSLSGREPQTRDERTSAVSKRYEIERLMEELMAVFAQQPRVAKHVFTRVLTEEGIETTAEYIHLFGESVVIDMLRDPSLQSDMSGLMEFYAKNPIELSDDEKLELLHKLHNRTVAGKLVVMGNRSSNLFDFLAEMDGLQIMELVRNESLTVKAIVLTQCDPQKRSVVYTQLDEEARLRLLTELSRIDYLPRDYIFNVAHALKRKRRENPRLNTEALPGSEVLVTLLERTRPEIQRQVVRNLDVANPESARTIKAKLVSIDTLQFLRDAQLLEVVLNLKHDELLQFLKGATPEVRATIFQKSPRELVAELEEELQNVSLISREGYQAIERKVLNRMKTMANEGLINLVEVNERMFGAENEQSFEPTGTSETAQGATVRKVAGW